MPIRRLFPILIVNVLVIMTVTMVIVEYPSHTRAAVLVMPLLFVANFLFFRKMQKKHAAAIASGTATPQSPAKMRVAMWGLGLYGVASYVSGAFDLPTLIGEHDFGPWLGWSVKMAFGTLCIWIALRIRSSLKATDFHSGQPK
jgi:hypothetical protein